MSLAWGEPPSPYGAPACSPTRRDGWWSPCTAFLPLVHDLFLTLLRNLDITVLSFPPVASIPALAMAVFLCSFVVAWLISKVPFIGRWLT